MKFHREGRTIISTTLLGLAFVNLIVFYLWSMTGLLIAALPSLVLLVLVLQFFRVPHRLVVELDGAALCPADGKVVVIEEVEETEYFKDRRIQVSIFMSPLNVHINWFPISGIVKYFKYHPGKYLVAWHPKSSTENERTTVVVQHGDGTQLLFRQIAGAVARRIVCYPRENDVAMQAEEFGFIKFGSRVDVFLPLGSEVKVHIGDTVQGSQTVLASLPKAAL
jgi:phosphatidylserine decarboxylase